MRVCPRIFEASRTEIKSYLKSILRGKKKTKIEEREKRNKVVTSKSGHGSREKRRKKRLKCEHGEVTLSRAVCQPRSTGSGTAGLEASAET